MIRLANLTKSYGRLTAVNNISLEIQKGEVFGFLGPNGAGKTTTIKIMAGLLEPSAGTVEIAGWDIKTEPVKAKAATGFIPDRPFIYEKLTAFEFMHFVSRLYSMKDAKKRIFDLLQLFGIAEWQNELVENFSHGMKQRLVMASALLHEPKVLVVDEPMVGLDPHGARLVKKIFREIASNGVTVFMSTHTLETAEQMCHRVAIINKGEIIATGSMGELGRMARMPNSRLEPIFLKLTGGYDAL